VEPPTCLSANTPTALDLLWKYQMPLENIPFGERTDPDAGYTLRLNDLLIYGDQPSLLH